MFKHKTIETGEKLPTFNLKNIDGNYICDETFYNSTILIVIFSCNHCPYARAYEDRIIDIQNLYKDKGVYVLLINSNDSNEYPEDSFENMIKRSNLKKFNFPYLLDDNQVVAKSFGASYTPEVFLFDNQKTLKYHGRIDDNWQEPDKVKQHILIEAIEDILNSREIKNPNNQAIGCTIKWKCN